MSREILFTRNYDLLMERFPAVALQLPPIEEYVAKPELLSFPIPENLELVYFYGLGVGAAYFHFRSWLQENQARQLVVLEEDLEAVASFLSKEECSEVLADLQFILAMPSDAEGLSQRFPLAHVEVYALPSKKGSKFNRLRLNLLRKTTLSHALHLDRLHGHQPFENFAANLCRLPRSFYANQMKDRFAGVPAIICGAGPSLQAAIPILRTLEKKALILAGGSTLSALSLNGIIPHFGMGVDPNKEEYHRLKNSFAFEVPFLYSTRIFPDVFSTCNGPFGYMRAGIGGMPELWIEEVLGLKEPLLGKHLNSEAISVTAICLAWAQFLGCNPIILSGVDLAYTEKKRYAPGVILESELDVQEKTRAADRLVKRKGINGKMVYTAVRWLMESASFSYFAKMHPETKFFNTTEGGIGFKKIPFCPLNEIVENFLVKEWDLRTQVHEEIIRSPMPENANKLIADAMGQLSLSLERMIAQLEVLSGDAKGSSALAEMELSEEMACRYLFYDIGSVLNKELSEDRKGEKWRHFLGLAKNYKKAFARFS